MMNPIWASGARRRMRSVKTPIVMTLFGALMLLMAYYQAILPLSRASITLETMRRGVDGYIFLLGTQFLLLAVVAPPLTAGSIAGERERQTLDLLLVTNTGSLRIALGKLLDSFGFLALLIAAMLPINCAVLLYGGVTVREILISAGFLVVVAFASLSVGLFASALFKRTVTAVIVSYLIMILIGAGTLLPMAYRARAIMEQIKGDTDVLSQLTSGELFKMVPLITWLNPIVGFLCLATAQTGVLESTIQYNLPGGNAFYEIFGGVGFEKVAYANAACMAAAALLLILLSALFVRPRTRSLRGRK